MLCGLLYTLYRAGTGSLCSLRGETATREETNGEAPAEGEQAPDFTLEGTDGTFTLSEHRGERVLLLFYPGDETTVCTKQFCSYRDNAQAFNALGVTAVGISARTSTRRSRSPTTTA